MTTYNVPFLLYIYIYQVITYQQQRCRYRVLYTTYKLMIVTYYVNIGVTPGEQTHTGTCAMLYICMWMFFSFLCKYAYDYSGKVYRGITHGKYVQ